MTDRRVCHVSNQHCTAPAGWLVGGGYGAGEGSCRATCYYCGEPVCGKCSRVVSRSSRRVRICDDCWEHE